MPKFAPEFMNEITRLARHEAGHYVAAKCMAFPTGKVVLEFKLQKGGQSGGSEVELPQALKDLGAVASYLERRISVLFAGALAQCLDGEAKVDFAAAGICLLEGEGRDDFSKAHELTNLLRNIRRPDESFGEAAQSSLQEICDYIWKATGTLVDREAQTILGLSDRLAEKVTAAFGRFEIPGSDIQAFPEIVALMKRLSVGSQK
jgi:hypothetical protein